MQVCRVTSKENYTNNVTSFILEGVTNDLFIVVLEDKSDGKIHTLGIVRGLNVIYDCIETQRLKLSHGNLSKCCESNRDFVKLCYIAELKDNRVHAKKLK